MSKHAAGNLQPATSLAYVIYTSGSTGKPKGVLVEHASVINLAYSQKSRFAINEDDRVLQFSTICFDASVEQIFIAFFSGAVLVIIDKNTILDTRQFDAFVSAHCITHIHAVPSFLNNMKLSNASISTLKRVISGGDVCPAALARKWSKHSDFYNEYGPTETTVTSIEMLFKTVDERLTGLPIGKPINNTTVYLLDRWFNPVPLGMVGELHIGGAGVARGYLNQPELTAEKFIKGTRGLAPLLYRSGDLARWLQDGNLEFLGRIDRQVKIRGFRIELGEIETRLLEHPQIKEVVVVTRDDERGDRYLAAYTVPGSSGLIGPDKVDELRSYLLQKLPDYMIPSYFIPLERIPLTPSGKVDWKALPGPEITLTKAYIAPNSETERVLVGLWSEILGMEREKISVNDNFFELGGHSLKATGLMTRIHKVFKTEVPLSKLFEFPTVRGLSNCIEGREKSAAAFQPIPIAEEREYYPLSPAQERFFIFQQMVPASTSYNMAEAVLMEGKLDKDRFEKCMIKIIHRHEGFRTSFHLVEGEPVQKIHETVKFAIEYCHVSNGSLEKKEIICCFNRSFDLSRAPLLRVVILHTGEERYVLVISMHHIISDGTSTGIFISDFLSFYQGKELSPLPLCYKDFVFWQRERKKAKMAEMEVGLVGTGLENPGEQLDLPIDYPRPTEPRYEGNTLRFAVEPGVFEALNRLVLKEDATLFMVILAICSVFLSKLSGQENIAVGSPIAGRIHNDLEHIIGLFINTLVLQNSIPGETSFLEFLQQVKKNTLAVFENQEFQYDSMIETSDTVLDFGANALFRVMFVMQNMEAPEVRLENLKIKRDMFDSRAAKFDMTLYAEEIEHDLCFKLEYDIQLFKETTIKRFIGYFKKIISEVLAHPHKKISGIEMITKEEKEQILNEFNDTVLSYPENKTIFQVFEEQVERRPSSTAVVNVGTREKQQWITSITYNQLNKKSNRLARILRKRGIKPDVPVGIMIKRSVEMLVGILAILKAGGAYLPVDPDYPENRIISMLEDSGASILLTTSGGISRLSSRQGISLMRIDEPGGEWANLSGGNLEPVSGPGNLIYIIFTSGSTGKPKGAGVYHRGFMNLMYWFVTEFGLEAADRNLFLTSLSFDLTQKNLYASLMKSGVICIPGLNYFDPPALLREIHRCQVTWINCTPGMFYKLVEFEESTGKEQLKSLRYVFLGGEPISLVTLIDWLESGYHQAQIVNTYGPTECTDICASYRLTEPRRFLHEVIPVGKPIYNVKLYVMDKNLQLLPVGIAGELLIGGTGLGTGYVNDHPLTTRKFITCCFNPGGDSPGEEQEDQLLYRTGDLVKWLEDGNIEFLGRMDYQVKVRGFRIEPGEIENQLLNHPKVKEAVVMPREKETGDTYLCAYLVPHEIENFPVSEVREYLRSELPGYMVPAYFITMEKMPLNPNGKVDRRSLPEPALGVKDDYTAPRDETEKQLVKVWAEVLKVEEEVIGIDDNFFHLGGHSIKAALLTSRIHKAFGVTIPLADIFKRPTIREIAQTIPGTVKERYAVVEAVEKKEFHALSSAQKRLYVLHQLDIHSNVYNMPIALILEGKVNKDKLEDIFRELIQRHESLRTSFQMIEGEPMQCIHDEVGFEIEYYLATENTENTEGTRGLAPLSIAPLPINNFIRPFALSKAPLLRVGLMTLSHTPAPLRGHPRPSQEVGGDKYLLMVDMHHIISDGISCGILVKEFMALSAGEKLPDLRLQYKDYSEWQRGEKQAEALIKQEKYWKKQFSEEMPLLELPTDYTRPAVQTFAGSHVTFEMGEDKMKALKPLALSRGTTLYTVLFALYHIFLSKLSNQEDIVVGTVTAGRQHADLEPIIGMFVNTLVVRSYPRGEKSFPTFLEEIKERSLEAFDNQDYQYEDLVEQVATARDTSRNPLFDTLFVLQDNSIPGIEIPGLKLTPLEYRGKTSKFDLLLIGMEIEEKLSLTFEYSTRLFTAATIRRFIGYFNKVAAAVIENTAVKLSEIEIISEEEKQQILVTFNRLNDQFPVNMMIHRLFAARVGKNPDAIALVHTNCAGSGGEEHVTYRQLNEISNGFASYLNEQGAVAGDLIGLMVAPSPGMLISILAAWKAGCGYVPLNPNAPRGRNKYILEECGTGILLTDSSSIEVSQVVDPGKIVDQFKDFRDSPDYPLHLNPNPSLLAYVIFTSGSTGKPKGVPIAHSNLTPLLHWGYKYMALSTGDRSVQNLAYYFDWSVWEIFIALTSGASLYTIGYETLLDPREYISFIRKNKITTLHITPTRIQSLINWAEGSKSLGTLRYLAIGAEKLTYNLVKRALALVADDCRLYNMYGPTEATIMSAVLEIDRSKLESYQRLSSVPIGTTISNTDLLVLNRYLQVCPVNITGELYIGGDGLCCGYLNDVEKSAHVFIKNIFPGQGIKGERLYKTGDLVRWLPDGTIEFLGRADFQVKIRGFRIEPGEIENQLLAHEKVKEALVIDRKRGEGETYLCAYIVPAKQENGQVSAFLSTGLKEYLFRELPDYMVPASFVLLDRMPINPNGKIDRKALPEPGAHDPGQEYAYSAPRNKVEEKLVEIWQDLLKVEPIGIHDDFFHSGGHSLKVLNLVNAIEKEFRVKIDFQDIFQYPTIVELSDLIGKSKPAVNDEIEIQQEKEYYNLSYAQKRLWFLYQLDPDNPAFNLPTRITLHEHTDETKVRKALEKLVKRHASFRTYFKSHKGGVVQIIRPQIPVNLETFDLSHLEGHARKETREQLFREESTKPFSLETPPLFRMKLIKCQDNEFDVILTMHHIITDGWSMEVLEREFTLLYESYKKGSGCDPDPLKIRYIDYVYWQERLLADKEKMPEAKKFWEKQLKGDYPILDLPYDFAGKNMTGKESAAYGIVIPGEIMQNLKKIAREYKASLFMVLLAGFNVLLYRVTGQYDLLLAVPGAARQHEDLKNIVGFFVNTLILRNKINPGESFLHFLAKVQKHTLQVLEYQSFPLELLCSEFKIRYPEISVFFNMSLFGDTSLESLKRYASYHIQWVQDAKFDMVCYLEEYKNGITIETHYYKELFKPMTIEGIMRLYRGIMEGISRDPTKKIDEYKYSLTGQKKKIKLFT
ncbi:MAG: amino acid adenylation domain-containing protein [Candidatus Aminicenantes bacterium]|nr:MAG: amino acid adenylation domain-containing protein [Candidatus Aminicenantes bacterium]